MPKNIKFEGFDTKCEFCGNLYSAQYIQFHIKERCLKSPQNINRKNLSENQPITISLVNFEPKKELSKKESVKPSAQTLVANNQLKQKEQKRLCPYCNFLIKPNKYEKHINKKCPQRNKKANVKIKARIKPLRRKPSINFTKPDKAYVPVQKNKIRCSKCNQIYLNSESQCPECLRIELRNQSLIKCPRCEKSFDENNYNKHLLRCFDPEICCLECKGLFSNIGFQSHIHRKIQEIPVELLPKRIVCDYCNSGVNAVNLEKHLKNSCVQVKIPCKICNVEILRHEITNHLLFIHGISSDSGYSKNNSSASSKKKKKNKSTAYVKPLALKKNSSPRRCRICGRIAMYNSGHCYTCGDK